MYTFNILFYFLIICVDLYHSLAYAIPYQPSFHMHHILLTRVLSISNLKGVECLSFRVLTGSIHLAHHFQEVNCLELSSHNSSM